MKHTITSFFLTISFVTTFQAHAASTLVSGGATIDYDAAAWASLAGGVNVSPFQALVLNEFFDQAGVTSRTGSQILYDEVVTSPSTTGLFHALNGSYVTNLPGRSNQATTFSYDPLALTAHTGVIGLGGITRWDVNPLLGGGVLGFGDFTFFYDTSRLLTGGSGWALRVNLPGGGVAFDLLNVTTNATNTSLSISGDMAVSYEMANFYLGTPSDHLKDVGNFSFTATAVPEASSALLGALSLAGLLMRRSRSA